MKNTIIILMFMILIIPTQGQELQKIWEINTLEAPESVVFNGATSSFYVSNVSGQPADKNGMGFISVLDQNGKITNKKWVSGLNAPKGMAIYENHLYIADIDRVVVADLNSGAIVKEYKAEGATFLNDVEAAADGTIFITDTFGGNAIYKIENDEISLWIKDEKLNYPNGLLLLDNKLFVSSWGVVTNPETFETEVPGRLLSIDLENREIIEISSPFGNLDGLQNTAYGFLVSDWIAGQLLTVSDKGKVTELLDLNPGSADILYLNEKNLVLVPQMLDGNLTAYQLSE